MTQTLTPPSIEPVPADPAAAPVVPVSSLLVATAFVHRGLAWWARFVLSIGHVNPSLTLDRLYMIHVAEWSTVRVRVKKRRPKRPLLVFVANHNAGADDYIASFALFLKSRINRAFGNNRDWQSITTTRLLTDYVVDHEQTVMCSYWAYPGATVTDIVVALNARRLWERLVADSGRLSAMAFRKRFDAAIGQLTRPPDRRLGRWLHWQYVIRSLLHGRKWRSSTFWIEIPHGRVEAVHAALQELSGAETEIFGRIGGVHFATLSMATNIVDGYPPVREKRDYPLQGTVLVLSIQHDGSRDDLLRRIDQRLDGRLAAVLRLCTADTTEPPRGWSYFLRRRRTRRGLTVNAYPTAPLSEVQAALPLRSALLGLAALPPDTDLQDLIRRHGTATSVPFGRTLPPRPAAANAMGTDGNGRHWLRHDLQGNVLEAYSRTRLPVGIQLLVHIPESGRPQEWLLDELSQRRVTTAANRPDESTFNVAITATGLRRWGVPAVALEGFPTEFVTGMSERAPQELGDIGPNDPGHWERRGDTHVVVLVRAHDEPSLRSITEDAVARLVGHGLDVIYRQATHIVNDGDQMREPFGFVDGISQPYLEMSRSPRRNAPHGQLPSALGEFVLGHPDEDGTAEPWTQSVLARNGTFLVYRKLQQHVNAFNAAVAQHGGEMFAAKMVGRTRDGVPLAVASTTGGRPIADFSYADDPDGYGCPVGAHIRRANPRDSLDKDAKRARRHRLIRRGMSYGEDREDMGTVFMAYCSHIQRQFEFVQGQWLQTGRVFGLGAEQDPLTGAGRFVVQASPTQIVELEQFITTRWGEYFLQPSMTALAYLAAGDWR